MTIEVTREDVAGGVPADWLDCPVARAFKRATGQTWYVDGLTAHQYMFDRTIDLPSDVVDAIQRYDEGGGLAPCAFDVTIPPPGAYASLGPTSLFDEA